MLCCAGAPQGTPAARPDGRTHTMAKRTTQPHRRGRWPSSKSPLCRLSTMKGPGVAGVSMVKVGCKETTLPCPCGPQIPTPIPRQFAPSPLPAATSLLLSAPATSTVALQNPGCYSLSMRAAG